MLHTIVSILAATAADKALDAKLTRLNAQVGAMQATASCSATCNTCINTAPYHYGQTGSAAASATALHSCTTACNGCMDVYCDHDTVELMIEKCNTTATISGIANTPTSPYANFWLSCSLCNAPPITVEQVLPPPAPPAPVAPPPPPPRVHVMAGWCNNWNHGDWPADSHHYSHYGNTANQAECFAHCDANPYCQQAVFESGGQWGNECWLGTNAMVQTPRAARGSCTGTPGCINNCYNRVGWPAA